mmetsp:Transcript_1255/g.4163  ORF Transcript_1255/g.4163 Transcript_1255/m.4163 type:complete len:267 (-) Transcript_1255:107-907(-)
MAATSDSVNRALGMVAARAATTAAPRLLSLSATPRSRPCASTRRRGRAPPRRWFASPFCSWRPPSTTSRSATPSARRRRGNPGATNTRRSIMRLASRRKTCRTIWRGSCTTRRSATVGPKVSTPSAPSSATPSACTPASPPSTAPARGTAPRPGSARPTTIDTKARSSTTSGANARGSSPAHTTSSASPLRSSFRRWVSTREPTPSSKRYPCPTTPSSQRATACRSRARSDTTSWASGSRRRAAKTRTTTRATSTFPATRRTTSST